MKLYELTPQLIELSNMDATDEAVLNTLECVQMDFNDKAVSIIKLSESLEADTSAIDNEIARLESRKKVILNRKKQLRDYLLHNMEAAGISKIECPLFTATLRAGSESVEVIDESQIPDEFVKVEIVEKIDKNAIKAAIRSGKEVNGAALKRGASTLVIK